MIKQKVIYLSNTIFNSAINWQTNKLSLKINQIIMSKLIYFKRYLYVIDRLRSRPCSFSELQDHVMHKLQRWYDFFEYAIRTFERQKTFQPFWNRYSIQPKDNPTTIDEEEIEDQSVTRMIDAFSIHHALQEGNKLSPVFLEKRKSLELNIFMDYSSLTKLYISITHSPSTWEDFSTNAK
jgi:hypothetical protein